MAQDRPTRTKSTGNRTPGPDQPGTPTSPDVEVVADVTHFHAGERDFHPRGQDPHYHGDDRLPVWGAWTPDGVKLWKYIGVDDPLEHRHDDRHQHSHDLGDQEHLHNPANDAVLPLSEAELLYASRSTAPSADAVVLDPRQDGFQLGQQAIRDALANGAANDPAAIEQAKEAARAASAHLAAAPTPQPPAIPVREGMSRPGTSIAHPGALSLLNTIHGVTDDALNHEMTWLDILAPLVIEAATFHADQRRQGGSGPELAPMELWMRARDAMEQIVLPRLARETQP